MREDDLPQLLAIEDESFRRRGQWRRSVRNTKHPETGPAWRLTAKDLIGYLVCRLLLMCMCWTWLCRPYRGCGVARLLLEELLHVAASSGDDVTLEVRPSNAAALAVPRPGLRGARTPPRILR